MLPSAASAASTATASASTALALPLLLLLATGLQAPTSAAYDFGYDGAVGPAHWSEQFATCAGKYQSPIDIEEHLVRHVRQRKLEFSGFDAPPLTSTLSNNGHTVLLQINTSQQASVKGGPLVGKYVFRQLHFHWGANSSLGSEATVNNHSFPMELHMVFTKEDYGSMSECLKHKDGLAVIGLFYMVYGPGNPTYNEIVETIPKVKEPKAEVLLKTPITLGSLLPENRVNYFTYNGSLTTPPCSEVVTWIEFKQPILLSESQVAVFRTIRSSHGEMTHNFRPVQPLGDRLVLFNMAELYGTACSKTVSSWLFVLSLGLLIL